MPPPTGGDAACGCCQSAIKANKGRQRKTVQLSAAPCYSPEAGLHAIIMNHDGVRSGAIGQDLAR